MTALPYGSSPAQTLRQWQTRGVRLKSPRLRQNPGHSPYPVSADDRGAVVPLGVRI